MQGYKDRRDESKGMNDRYKSKGMNLKDNTQASPVRSIKVPEGQGWREVKPYRSGNRGYPSEAFNYDY